MKSVEKYKVGEVVIFKEQPSSEFSKGSGITPNMRKYFGESFKILITEDKGEVYAQHINKPDERYYLLNEWIERRAFKVGDTVKLKLTKPNYTSNPRRNVNAYQIKTFAGKELIVSGTYKHTDIIRVSLKDDVRTITNFNRDYLELVSTSKVKETVKESTPIEYKVGDTIIFNAQPESQWRIFPFITETMRNGMFGKKFIIEAVKDDTVDVKYDSSLRALKKSWISKADADTKDEVELRINVPYKMSTTDIAAEEFFKSLDIDVTNLRFVHDIVVGISTETDEAIDILESTPGKVKFIQLNIERTDSIKKLLEIQKTVYPKGKIYIYTPSILQEKILFSVV